MPYQEINRDSVIWLYERMLLIRRFEEQARREADLGKLRGIHSSIGQEAVPTGVCAHLNDNDYVLGTHRSHHHCIAKGVDLNEMMSELFEEYQVILQSYFCHESMKKYEKSSSSTSPSGGNQVDSLPPASVGALGHRKMKNKRNGDVS